MLCCVNVLTFTWFVLTLSYDETIHIEHLKATLTTNCAILLADLLIYAFDLDCTVEIINEMKQCKTHTMSLIIT